MTPGTKTTPDSPQERPYVRRGDRSGEGVHSFMDGALETHDETEPAHRDECRR